MVVFEKSEKTAKEVLTQICTILENDKIAFENNNDIKNAFEGINGPY